MAIDTQNQRSEFFSHELKAGLSWRLFTFLAIIFTVSVLTYAGLQYGYRPFLDRSIVDYENILRSATARFGAAEQSNLIGFYSQTVNLRSLFKSHILSSKVFTFLESATSPKIAYTSADLSIAEKQLTLSGVTDSYETLINQIISFERYSGVQKVLLGDNSFSDTGVARFTVKVIFNENFFLPSENQ